MKKSVTNVLATILWLNIIIFLSMAYFEKLSSDARALVFIDFWGRLCVYSLWYLCYTLYRNHLYQKNLVRRLIEGLVVINIPLFLLLGFFDKLNATPQTLPFIDFWGRITVYSAWFIGYEAYRQFMHRKDFD